MNRVYSNFHLSKYSSHAFPIEYGLKQGNALPPFPFNLALEQIIKKVQENQAFS
jgi:hypothetical protein